MPEQCHAMVGGRFDEILWCGRCKGNVATKRACRDYYDGDNDLCYSIELLCAACLDVKQWTKVSDLHYTAGVQAAIDALSFTVAS